MPRKTAVTADAGKLHTALLRHAEAARLLPQLIHASHQAGLTYRQIGHALHIAPSTALRLAHKGAQQNQ